MGAAQRLGNRCYGLDVRGDEVVIVRAERSRGRAVTQVVTRDAFLADEMHARTAVASMSVRAGFARWLEAPFSVVSKAQKVFPTLLDIQLPFALDDCVYRFLDVGQVETRGDDGEAMRKTRALAVAARRKDVAARIAELQEQSLDPVALDHEGLALWAQSLAEAPVAPGEARLPRVVVSLAGEGSAVVIGNGPAFLNAHGVQEDDPGQVLRLLRAQLDVGKDHERPSVIWFYCGPGAVDSERVRRFAAVVEKEWPGEAHTHDNPGAFLARALALRALQGGALCCNLRMDDLTHTAVQRREMRQSLVAPLVFLVAGLVLCAGNMTWHGMMRAREGRIDDAYIDLATSLGGDAFQQGARGPQGLLMVRGRIEKRKAELLPFRRLMRPSLTHLIRRIVDAGGTYSFLYDSLVVSDTDVRIKGTALDYDHCAELRNVINKERRRVSLERSDPRSDERIPFVVIGGGAK